MGTELDAFIAEAKGLARAGNEEAAMSLATELALRFPSDARVWFLLSCRHRGRGELPAAIADLTRAIGIEPLEVSYFFNRGTDELQLRNYASAVSDFSRGLELCERLGDSYFRETLYFLRAEALLKIDRTSDALADLANVSGDFTYWTDRLRSKQELLLECTPQVTETRRCPPRRSREHRDSSIK